MSLLGAEVDTLPIFAELGCTKSQIHKSSQRGALYRRSYLKACENLAIETIGYFYTPLFGESVLIPLWDILKVDK
jgi:hypothetical protein